MLFMVPTLLNWPPLERPFQTTAARMCSLVYILFTGSVLLLDDNPPASRDPAKRAYVESVSMSASKIVLVADDSENDFFLLQTAFKFAGLPHLLIPVSNGQMVVAYLQGEKPFSDRTIWPLPDILILDVKMPILGGFDVLRFLRQHPDLKAPAAVMLSGSILKDDQRQAASLGAAAY